MARENPRTPPSSNRGSVDAAEAAEYIEEGIQLNLPCKVTTKPSDDGRYLNVDVVYPQGNGEART